jgi:hypothetical protein
VRLPPLAFGLVSVTVERPRKRSKPDPNDAPIRDRPTSSLAMISERLRQLHFAVAAADEEALRSELRKLSAEAALLAEQDAVLPSAIAARMRIYSQRQSSGRGAS